MTPDPLTPSPDSPTPRCDSLTFKAYHVLNPKAELEVVESRYFRKLERENYQLHSTLADYMNHQITARDTAAQCPPVFPQYNSTYPTDIVEAQVEIMRLSEQNESKALELAALVKEREEIELIRSRANLVHETNKLFNATLAERDREIEKGRQWNQLLELENKNLRSIYSEDGTQELHDTLDLMVDEFRRIRSLTDNYEVNGLCDRAVSGIKQLVPVIEQRDRAESELRSLRAQLAETQEKLKEAELTIETAEGRMMVHPADNRTLRDLVSAHLVAEDKLRGELFTAEAHIGVLREALSRISNLYFGEATAIAKDALASQPDLPLIEGVRAAATLIAEIADKQDRPAPVIMAGRLSMIADKAKHILTRLNPTKL